MRVSHRQLIILKSPLIEGAFFYAGDGKVEVPLVGADY
ncbi:hypothetical protein J502_2063 [Acinetobacter sp. 1294596]|nr:hypothetical protein J502_2063 [Acinetobacter sp. 1294596]